MINTTDRIINSKQGADIAYASIKSNGYMIFTNTHLKELVFYVGTVDFIQKILDRVDDIEQRYSTYAPVNTPYSYDDEYEYGGERMVLVVNVASPAHSIESYDKMARNLMG